MKLAQEPTGRTYIGMLTLPFRDFSYVLKVQCEERGFTGAREAIVLDGMLRSGEVVVANGIATGFADDPYDPTNRTPMVRNRSERPEFDARFPDHPLSRARRMLDLFERTINVSDRVRREAPFVYPPKSA